MKKKREFLRMVVARAEADGLSSSERRAIRGSASSLWDSTPPPLREGLIREISGRPAKWRRSRGDGGDSASAAR